MISTLLRIAWLSLVRDRMALLLTFLIPIAFFSIFAGIFGNMGGGDGGMAPVSVVLVDEDQSDISQRLVKVLQEDSGLVGPKREPQPSLLENQMAARELVENGHSDLGIIIPQGFGGEADLEEAARESETLVVLADTVANPVAHQMMQGLLQQAVMTAAPERLATRGLQLFEKYSGDLTESQRKAVDGLNQLSGGGASGVLSDAMTPVRVSVDDVRIRDQSEERRGRMVAFQAAGIGVMFLLFSMARAAGALLEEQTTGTLERLLSSKANMNTLLAGYWLFAAGLGFLQLTVMFTWGWAVFGLDLWTVEHVTGFILMTTVTAAAAASLGLVLGTACRTASQLSGLSTLVVLVMSALGGSMVPRFLLRENPLFDKLGLLTFNAWAIDGYQKVFWYESGLLSLAPQVGVLLTLTVVFLAVARILARRWETL